MVIPDRSPDPQAIQRAVLRAGCDERAGGRIARGVEKTKSTVAFAPQSARANKKRLFKATPAWSKSNNAAGPITRRPVSFDQRFQPF
jgi:hypothetical protein